MKKRSKLASIVAGAAFIVTTGCTISCNSLNKPDRYRNILENISYDVCNGTKMITVDNVYCDGLNDTNCFIDESVGTGTIIKSKNEELYVLTAGHIAEQRFAVKKFGKLYFLKSSKITINKKGINLDVLVSELNEKIDYALLKGKCELKTTDARLGNSDKLRNGDLLYICGHPFALGRNTTVGIVSAKDVVLEDFLGIKGKKIESQFLFTTPISPGNSGSAIYATENDELYLVGIAVASFGGQNINVGIKINDIYPKIKGFLEDKVNQKDGETK